ncbi:unnamed protein product [Acanthosepion pharaonis]|uniref:Uncharacterized protein n=1 Tax=Acanthosepion pharaonis TaxID=158019 RepID=A0A812EPR3_ACAPH|nr:unnamed protein product [Sepia pharaonis]
MYVWWFLNDVTFFLPPTGQCVVCLGGHEKLLTTWLLHSMSSSCDEKWKANRIGRDIFTRYQQKPGPRKDKDTHIPERPLNYSFSIEGNSKSFVKVKNSQEPATPTCRLEGTWYNELGSEIILSYDKSGIIKGEYRTAVERQEGTAGNTHSLIYGIGNYHEPNTTFGFHVVWRKGASVTGFVGQCHSTCGLDEMETLEVNWILWQSIEKCQDHWRSTLYGINSFTKYEQAAGPRKMENTHFPNRAGEDIEEEEPTSASSHSIHGRHLAIIPVLFYFPPTSFNFLNLSLSPPPPLLPVLFSCYFLHLPLFWCTCVNKLYVSLT